MSLGESGQRALLARCYFNLSAWSELWPMLRADAGLRIKVDGAEHLLPVDHVVVCAGQEPRRARRWKARGRSVARGIRPKGAGCSASGQR